METQARISQRKAPKECSMHLVEEVASTTNEVESPEEALLWLMRGLENVRETIEHFYDMFDRIAPGPRPPTIDPEMVKSALTVIDYHLDGVMSQWWPKPAEKPAEVHSSASNHKQERKP